MIILQEHSSNGSNSIGYTWDESWILPYESIRSLLHKFTLLNRISLDDCKALFKPESSSKGYTNELGSKLSIQKMTEIIGLGISLDRSMVHEIAHPSDRQWLLSPYLRLCSACFEMGFHSIFHQVTLITKCPIHHVNLVSATCGECGSHELYECMGSAVSKYGVAPFTCAKCGNKLWRPYSNDDTPHRNLLSITLEQKERLNDLYDWLTASARLASSGASMKRWQGMAGLLSFPPPIGMVPHKKSIYELRGREISVCRGIIIGTPAPQSILGVDRRNITTSIAKFGFKAGGGDVGKWSCNINVEPTFDDSGIVYKKEDQAIHDSLRPVYKSLRRHFAKIFLGHKHRNCARSIEKAMWWEAGPDSNTQICPWAFAYLFWRRNWEKSVRINQPTKYVDWKNSLLVRISAENQAQNEWATQRIFALECFWTFQESVLLARWMARRKTFSWDLALMRGRLIPYWFVDNQSAPRTPSILWWSRKTFHSKALTLNVSLRRHRKDVAMQVSILREI